jgi:hypothetical protein
MGQWELDELRKVLIRLAADAMEQTRYLEEIGTAPCTDELALELDDLRYFWEQDARFSSVTELDAYLDSISGMENSEIWTTEALATRPEWTHVRALANAALDGLRRNWS